MASPQINEILLTLVRSPRGLVALLAVLGSLVAFAYLFLLKSSSPTSKSKSRSPNKRSVDSSKKAAGSVKKTPASKDKPVTQTIKKSETKKSKEEQAAGSSAPKKTHYSIPISLFLTYSYSCSHSLTTSPCSLARN